MFKIKEFLITPSTYIADTPSSRGFDQTNTPSAMSIDAPGLEPKIGKQIPTKKKRKKKVESLIEMADAIVEKDLISDIQKYYWEVTSSIDTGYTQLHRYPDIKYKAGDIVWILKRTHTKLPKERIEHIKSEFDKVLLPKIKKEADLIASGPEFYHFRPKQSSKLLKRGKEFGHTEIGGSLLGLIGAMTGFPGLSTIFKSVKEPIDKLRG